MSSSVVPLERIQRKIYLIRGQKVMLDADLAGLYGVETFNLNKAVTRNKDRFPEDFMFQLSNQELKDLKFQIGISSVWGGRRTPPYAFTEQGVAMLSSVLRSKTAIRVNIQIIRSFVTLRELLLTNEVMARRMHAVEQKVDSHSRAIMSIIEELEKPTELPKKQRIGF